MPRGYRKRMAAEEYFIAQGLMPKREDRTERWYLHHIDPNLKYNNPDQYYEWRIEDLMPVPGSKHCDIHLEGHPRSPETRAKISKKMMGNKNGYHTEGEETRRKKSEAQKGLRTGKKLYNNGAINKLFVPGTEPAG